ncbi:hypothetical protein [Azospirillum sp. B4]|uniref:hypothetical protein n=1 Tax=Azospirillum sp. B4 TaxID=95605 RepID=UPI0011DCD896|nr:hypothetical protein [Azospirillum sp. B4]
MSVLINWKNSAVAATIMVAISIMYACRANSIDEINDQVMSKIIIESSIQDANEIIVYHSPERLMGRVGLSRETVSQNWIAMMSYRCNLPCILEKKNIINFLSLGIKTEVVPKGDVATLIVFKEDDKELIRIYGHWSGHAITIGNDNFILRESLTEYLETHSPFQW